jgi:hypothetical protein
MAILIFSIYVRVKPHVSVFIYEYIKVHVEGVVEGNVTEM